MEDGGLTSTTGTICKDKVNRLGLVRVISQDLCGRYISVGLHILITKVFLLNISKKAIRICVNHVELFNKHLDTYAE